MRLLSGQAMIEGGKVATGTGRVRVDVGVVVEGLFRGWLAGLVGGMVDKVRKGCV